MTHEIRALPVVDEANRLVGVVTLRDLVIAHEGKMIAFGEEFPALKIRKIEEIMARRGGSSPHAPSSPSSS